MRHLITKRRFLRHSTAISLALSVASPHVLPAFAQSDVAVEVDCEATPDAAACSAQTEVAPLVEQPVETAPAVEAEAVIEEPAPAVEAEAPVEAPVEEVAQPEPVETETVVEAEAAPSEEPVAQPVAQDVTAPADPVEQPASDSAEASETPPAGDAAPVTETMVEAVTETAVEAETPPPAPEQSATQEPESVEPTVTGEPSVPDPLEVPAPVVEEAAPSDAPQSEAPSVETVELAVQDPASEVEAQAAAAVSEDAVGPASVVPDDISAEQAAEVQAREERRREEARERRNELLGAAAVGAVIGAIIPALGGRVVEDQGDRIIVERGGEFYVRGDEGSLLRDGDVDVWVERLDHGATRETVTRRNGAQIVTVRNAGGYIIYRSRIRPDGQEIVLIDNRLIDDRAPIDITNLPPLRLTLPPDVYIVPARQANYDTLYDTFNAQPVVEIKERYSLRQVRENEELRALVRRVDVDTVTFETGQATVRASQVPQLEDLARAAIALINENPETLLLVEGHTDAVGSDIYNLALSDRRAETVARILANVYGVPPENMIVQGYGESYLKVDTQGPEEANRRVTMRNITPLVVSSGR